MGFPRRLANEARPFAPRFVLGGALALAEIALVAVAAGLIARTIARGFAEGWAAAELARPLALLAAVFVIRAAAAWLRERLAIGVAAAIARDLRRRLLWALARAEGDGARPPHGEIAAVLIDAIDALHAFFALYLPQAATALIVPLAVVAVVGTRDLLSAGILFATMPLIPLFMVLAGRAAEAQQQKRWAELARMSGRMLDALTGLVTLKLFGRAHDEIATVAEAADRFRVSTMATLRIAFVSGLVLELIATLSVAVVAVEIGIRLLYGHIGFEAALFVLLLAPEFYQPVRTFAARYHAALEAQAASDRIWPLLDATHDMGTGALRGQAHYGDSRITGTGALRGQAPRVDCPHIATVPVSRLSPEKVEVRGVALRYAARSEASLEGVTLAVERGEVVALVGPSGAGKSSVLRLLLRLAEPDEGALALDGVPAASIDRDLWRRAFVWVPERPHLLHDTVAANIRLARPDATVADIESAAERALFADVARALPQGYDTVVGERGARLSGGQIRRLALARAFLSDAPFVLLDEPAAFLDQELEHALTSMLADLARTRGVLVVTHRFAIARAATRVVMLERGRVVEAGAHDALVQRGGRYAQLALAARTGL